MSAQPEKETNRALADSTAENLTIVYGTLAQTPFTFKDSLFSSNSNRTVFSTEQTHHEIQTEEEIKKTIQPVKNTKSKDKNYQKDFQSTIHADKKSNSNSEQVKSPVTTSGSVKKFNRTGKNVLSDKNIVETVETSAGFVVQNVPTSNTTDPNAQTDKPIVQNVQGNPRTVQNVKDDHETSPVQNYNQSVHTEQDKTVLPNDNKAAPTVPNSSVTMQTGQTNSKTLPIVQINNTTAQNIENTAFEEQKNSGPFQKVQGDMKGDTSIQSNSSTTGDSMFNDETKVKENAVLNLETQEYSKNNTSVKKLNSTTFIRYSSPVPEKSSLPDMSDNKSSLNNSKLREHVK